MYSANTTALTNSVIIVFYHDDIVEFNGEVIQVNVVKLDKEDLPVTTKIKTEKTLTKQSAFKKTKNKKAKNKTDNQPQTAQVNDTPRSKRKPISF